MIVVSNRMPITPGFEKEFEERFNKRAHLVEGSKGFIKTEVLRPCPDAVEGNYYVVLSYWEDQDSFMAWTESESFREAHKNKPPEEMFTGPNVFEMHEVIDITTKK